MTRITVVKVEDTQVNAPLMEAVIDLAGTLDAISVFRAAWGESDVQDVDTYFAAASHGSYLGVGRIDGRPVAAAFGLLSRDYETGGMALHSHMAAVVPDLADNGIGRLMKMHQRQWALERGIEAMTWTFDPLQRRNAWFNLVRLGAVVCSFHRNMYGALDDQINGTDETDRLEVRWFLNVPVGASPVVAMPGDRVVAVPSDIGALRRSDPAAADAERNRMRAELLGLESGNERLVGMTQEKAYVFRAVGDDSSRTSQSGP